MRNIRDYKSKVRNGKLTLGSTSPFNIITKALTLANFSLEEIVRDVVGEVNFPILAKVAYGHGRRKMALPLGARVRLDADSQTISFLAV